MVGGPTLAEMVEAGFCPHEETRQTPNFRERFCFDCELFIDVVTGQVSYDGKTRIALDDEIEAMQGEPADSKEWPRLMAHMLILAMGNPDRPTTRCIFKAYRAWIRANEREAM